MILKKAKVRNGLKIINLILIAASLCLASTCQKNSEDCHYSFKVKNNSGTDIYFDVSSIYPDTNGIINNPSPLGQGDNRINKYSTESDVFQIRGCWENRFTNNYIGSDTLMIYILDANLVDNSPWDSITQNYLVLKRYDLSLDDLKRMNWTISYP